MPRWTDTHPISQEARERKPLCFSCHFWQPRADFPQIPGPQLACVFDLRLGGRALACTHYQREPGSDDA